MWNQYKLFGRLFLFKTLSNVFRFRTIKANGKSYDIKMIRRHNVTLCTHFLSCWFSFHWRQQLQIIVSNTSKTNMMEKLPWYRDGIICQLASSYNPAEWHPLLLHVIQCGMWRKRGEKAEHLVCYTWTEQSLLRQALIGELEIYPPFWNNTCGGTK
jgi:hypothetical protein